MKKLIGLIILYIGICFLAVSGYQFWNQHKGHMQSMQKMDRSIKKNKIEEKEFKPLENEVIGKLSIPKINVNLPIIEGTDEEDLKKGVGHYSASALPGENDQILLSGHRDTMFRRFDEIKIGDHLLVELPYGKYEYEIKKTKIVPAHDTTVIRSTAPKEVLLVSTCYPFRYIGNAPDRFIVYAYPIK